MSKSTDSKSAGHFWMKRGGCDWLNYAKGEFSMTSGHIKKKIQAIEFLRTDPAGAPVAKKDSQEVPVFKIS